jgi:hypothetical protein
MVKNSARWIWNGLKGILPARVLNSARFVYSPGYRQGRRALLKQRFIGESLKPVWAEAQGKVQSGPFSGMRYIQSSAGSALAPKILGTYELELWSPFEKIIAQAPSFIVDIGAAEGFYAVGLALRLPNCRIIAFEAEPEAQHLLRELAALNGVSERIEIEGFCDAHSLDDCLESVSDHSVIICDAEGAEVGLLDPKRNPRLSRLELLVELHHWVQPDPSKTLAARFGTSSQILPFSARPRTLSDFPMHLNVALSDRQKLACMDELRPEGMEWEWIRPLRGAAPDGGRD